MMACRLKSRLLAHLKLLSVPDRASVRSNEARAEGHETMISRAAVTAMLLAASVPSLADDAPFQKPTALELFQLRSMCQKLGEAFEYLGKGATPELKWMAGGMRNSGEDIHYNTKDGHCYLLARFIEDDVFGCTNWQLYDVQTREYIAGSYIHSGCQKTSRKGSKDFGQTPNEIGCHDADCAEDFINSKMKE